MNISAVNIFNINSNTGFNKVSPVSRSTVPFFGLRFAPEQTGDVVTFTGKTKPVKAAKKIVKVVESGTKKDLCIGKNATENGVGVEFSDIPNDMVIKIHKLAANEQPKINKYMENLLGDLVESDKNPMNVIVKLKGRAKTADSIREKALTRGWFTKEDILKNMTDINGMKIVVRGEYKNGFNQILERFINEIKAGRLELVEIENKRPVATRQLKGKSAAKYDYAPSELLREMYDTMKEKHPKREVRYVSVDYTDTNYCALHFLFRLPGMKRCFELQMTGRDVALYKEFDDVLFKILNHKKVSKKYKEIADAVSPLNEPENEEIKKGFNKYRANVFYSQRRKEPNVAENEDYAEYTLQQKRMAKKQESKSREYFLPIIDEIKDAYFRTVLDMNHLYELYLEAQKKAAK